MQPQYAMAQQPQTMGQQMGRTFVSSLVMGFGLLVLRVILTSLPMIKHAGPIGDTGLPVVVVVKVLLDSAIFAVLLLFTIQVQRMIAMHRPELADLGMLVLLLGATVTSALAYNSYQVMQMALMPEQGELYNWLFILLVLGLLTFAVITVVRRLDFFTNLLYNGFAQAGAQPSGYGPPMGTPPVGGMGVNPEMAAWQNRYDSLAPRVARAAQLAQGRGLPPELQQAVGNMQAYLQSGQQHAGRMDWGEAKRCLDWAEYESSRVMAALGQ
jgi:hypothetical protein